MIAIGVCILLIALAVSVCGLMADDGLGGGASALAMFFATFAAVGGMLLGVLIYQRHIRSAGYIIAADGGKVRIGLVSTPAPTVVRWIEVPTAAPTAQR